MSKLSADVNQKILIQASFSRGIEGNGETLKKYNRTREKLNNGHHVDNGSYRHTHKGERRTVRPRLIFVVNQLAFFVSHRLPLAGAAKAAGFEVHIAYGEGLEIEVKRHIEGCQTHFVPMERGGVNPLNDIVSLWKLFLLFRRVRPSIAHLITLKPVVYGGIAAKLAGVPGVVAAFAGMGYSFTEKRKGATRLIRLIMRPLFRIALSHQNVHVIVQNREDRALILHLSRVATSNVHLIGGSGLDVAAVTVRSEPGQPHVVAMAARLLYDKGVAEFVEAARIFHRRGRDTRFILIGAPDKKNPTAIPKDILEEWRTEGHVEMVGQRDDVVELFARSHVVVLPSYREGFPKTLMEAAACGRAVVTTDVPGCRDAIISGVTGLLVPAFDPESLAAAIDQLCTDADLRNSMAVAGRKLAETAFDIRSIVSKHLDIYKELM